MENAKPKVLKIVLIQLSVRKGSSYSFRMELIQVGAFWSICSFLKSRFQHWCFQVTLCCTGPWLTPTLSWRPRLLPAYFNSCKMENRWNLKRLCCPLWGLSELFCVTVRSGSLATRWHLSLGDRKYIFSTSPQKYFISLNFHTYKNCSILFITNY